jgi:hypothetical protein
MIKNIVASILLAMGFMLLPLTSAQAEDRYCSGPWMQLQAGKEWGPESSCNCQVGGHYVRGGVLASTNGWAWLWSEGKGVVRVVIEATHRGGGFDGKRVLYMQRANGKPYAAENGNGVAEQMYFPNVGGGELKWTEFYRSECYVQS